MCFRVCVRVSRNDFRIAKKVTKTMMKFEQKLTQNHERLTYCEAGRDHSRKLERFLRATQRARAREREREREDARAREREREAGRRY